MRLKSSILKQFFLWFYLALTACGMQGDLYLPEETVTTEQQADGSASESQDIGE